MRSGPLTDVRVVEFAGLGPAPYAAMLLADLGADVLTIQRPGATRARTTSIDLPLHRGRRVVELDLREPADRDAAGRLVDGADVLLEGFRPGVMERLGFGPQDCCATNPGLVYARMTGWGQTGPWAQVAGHDINYLALSGSLHAIGTADGPPVVPLNLVGDFGGGGMMMAFGVLAALHERGRSGQGQVVDAAIVDGIGSLSTMMLGYLSTDWWTERRGANRLDGGNPCYAVYVTADGGAVAVGALEPKFYAELVRTLGLDDLPDRDDPANWPELRRRLAAVFATRTRDDWATVFDASDACVTPVLTWSEAAVHPHIRARGAVLPDGNGLTSSAVPVFSRTPGSIAPSVPVEPAELGGIAADWSSDR
jgi:alpha-methylacyl-CoA racemase